MLRSSQEKQRGEENGRNVRIKAQQLVCKERRKHCRRQQRAMCEVDDVQHAVDQRQAERDERVSGAGH
jgi:uncharacterized membrane-anchored protein